MTRLLDRLRHGGRKYAVVLYTLELGALLALTALLVAAMIPSVATQAANIVNAFGILGGISVGAYQGANAAADWHTQPKPAQRQSGVVQVPDA
jgi:hypothetical protein